MGPKVSGTIRRCELVGAGLALLEEVCPGGTDIVVSYAQDTAQGPSPLPAAF